MSLHIFTILMKIRNALWIMRLLYSLKCFFLIVYSTQDTPTYMNHLFYANDKHIWVAFRKPKVVMTLLRLEAITADLKE